MTILSNSFDIFSRVMQNDEILTFLEEGSVNVEFPALDNLTCCKLLLDRFNEPIQFESQLINVDVAASQIENRSLLQKHPELFDATSPTMDILYAALQMNGNVTVAIRDTKCKHEFVTVSGKLIYFDKHFNLMLEDCKEKGCKYIAVKEKKSEGAVLSKAAKRRKRNNFIKANLSSTVKRLFIFGCNVVYVQKC